MTTDTFDNDKLLMVDGLPISGAMLMIEAGRRARSLYGDAVTAADVMMWKDRLAGMADMLAARRAS